MIQLNKTVVAFALITVTLLILSQQEREQPSLQLITHESTILCFGDSLTFGTGASPSESYPARLKSVLGCTIINAGVPGETTHDGIRRFTKLLDQHQPQLVILCEGGNDFLRKMPSSETEENLSRMIKEAQFRNVEVLLLGVPKPGLLVATSVIYVELAEQHNIALLEDNIADILSNNALKSDYVHPNATGYQILANTIFEKLNFSLHSNK